MSKFKYNDGDRIGPYNILMVKRTKKGPDGRWRGVFECPIDGTLFETRISGIVGGIKSCGCSRKKLRPNRIKDLTSQKFGHLTVQYLIKDKRTNNNGTIWHCICDCKNKNEIDVSSDHLQSGHVASCGCITKSLGEEKIELILKNLKIRYETQKRFIECKYKKPLPFDFYLPDYNCCIEYDGIQHFEDGHWEELNKIQKRDNIKNQYCKENNIKLIRIPYIDFKKIDEKYILERIGEINE